MQGITSLVAIKDIPVTTGVIRQGSIFQASDYLANVYLTAGFAVRREDYVQAGWQGLSWKGATVVILASGPSFSEEQAAAVLRWRNQDRNTRKVVAINTTYQRAPWADLLYACDRQWWQVYHERVKLECPGMDLWTQDPDAAKKHEINYIKSLRGEGLSLTPGVIHQGENSGYQAIGLVYQAGVSVVYLLGYDMQGCHWHGPHPGILNKPNPYSNWLRNFNRLAVDCKTVGLEVVNCTLTTALRSFPQKHWTEVFHDNDVPYSPGTGVPQGSISERPEEHRV